MLGAGSYPEHVMASAPKKRRAVLGDRIREAARQAAGISDLAGATEAQRNEYFDRLEEMGVSSRDPAGEVLGAGTGRARRAIQLEDEDAIVWDPIHPYPQIHTRSMSPERPRTVAAGYDPDNAIIRVTFRNGVTYEYLGPSPQQWEGFKRAPSPGRYIDDVLEQYPYRPSDEV